MSRTGVVERIGKKTGQGKRGPWTLYSINVDGDWYSLGFEAPPCSEGDTITFDVGKNDRGYDTAENIAVSAPSEQGTDGGTVKNRRQVSIEWQSSHKDALELLPTLLQYEAVVFPAKAKAGEKYDAIMAIVDEIAVQNFVRLQQVAEDGGVDVEDFIPAPGE